MAPPRAKTVWTDLTSLVRSTDDPATMVWASSWPPNTTPPNPVSKFWARNRPSPAGSRSRTLRNPDGSDISASPRGHAPPGVLYPRRALRLRRHGHPRPGDLGTGDRLLPEGSPGGGVLRLRSVDHRRQH